MVKYYLLILWIGFMSIVAGNQYRLEYSRVTGEEEWHISKATAFITILPLIWMAGTRASNIGDTSVYISNFNAMPVQMGAISTYLESVKKDQLFSILSVMIKSIISSNSTVYLLIIAFVQLLLLSRFYRQFSGDFFFSMFLFVASADYSGWMYNGIRQFLAVTIAICATPSILRYQNTRSSKELIKIIGLILLASGFHRTALVMLPILYICQGNAFSKKSMLAMVVAIVAVFFADRFNLLLIDVFDATEYAASFRELDGIDDGVHGLRVAVYSVPAIIAFINRKRVQLLEDAFIGFCVNMSILTAGLYLIGMISSGILVGRIPIYCSLFNYILLPWELQELYPNGGGVLKLVTVAFYLLYCFFAVGAI